MPKQQSFPAYVLFVLLGLSLLGSVRVSELQPAFPAVDAFIPYAFAVGLVWVVVRSAADGAWFKGLWSVLFLAFNLFGLWLLFGALFSPEPLTSLMGALLLVLMLNTVYVCVYGLSASHQVFVGLAFLFLGFTAVACLYALFLLHVDVKALQLGDFRWRPVNFSRRISSFLGNPNLLGAFIALSLPACYYWLVADRRWFSRLAALLCLGVLVYTLWLSASRASILSGLFGAVVFALLFLQSRKHPARWFVFFFVVLGVGAFAWLFFFDRDSLLDLFNQALNRRTSLLSGRDKAWVLLLDGFKQHPLLGMGFQVSQKYLLIPGGFTNPYGSHNIFLRLAAESGLVGLLSFLWFVFLSVVQGFRGLNRPGPARDITILCLSVVVTFLAHAFFEDNLNPVSALFMFPMICTMGLGVMGLSPHKAAVFRGGVFN